MGDFVAFEASEGDHLVGDYLGTTSPRDTVIQVLLSTALGVGAFLAFCVLRPRWTGLYAARKRRRDEAVVLPELPDSMFGWIMPLWRITDQQILASAGLDAYVFLQFFKMAMKFMTLLLLFSLVVIKPVHDAYPEDDEMPGNGTGGNKTLLHAGRWMGDLSSAAASNHSNHSYPMPYLPENLETDYLWMYIVFAYLFSGIAIHLIISETRKVIGIRQEFLGSQVSVTDRTMRLSGIPYALQSEENIKDFIESLDIGKVESVTLCRVWKELDDAMVARMNTLRRLEEAYVIYLGQRAVERNHESLPIAQPPPPLERPADADDGDETDNLIDIGHPPRQHAGEKIRPLTTLRYGFLGLRSRKVDTIDYYEEQLRQADDLVRTLREKEFLTTPLAFVTMDSPAACQMAIQAVLDPSPLQLIANQSPAPADVIWPNTYLSRRNRVIRSWSITALIIFLTVFWSVIFVPIAGLLNVDTIGKVLPQVKEALKGHANVRSLINTQLPTLASSLLMVLVPYLYYWLSCLQGHISQGDIELSAISKNFFFTFFNFFVIFTVLGTASKFYEFLQQFGDALRDFQRVAYTLALALQKLLSFYVNFIILQGIGLHPLRLLEMGSVSLYPIYLMGAKTPRDYAELVQPPRFYYGFYLPNALLIFIICMVYSVLRSSWQVLLAGLLYFMLGHFVYKYQLLYAMDHRQQSTGRAWGMICDRVFVGLVFFQVTTAGELILKRAIARSVLLLPLLIATIWVSIMYGRVYKPLMSFIALSSVRRGESYADQPNSGGSSYRSPPYAASLSSTNLAPERNIWAASDGDENGDINNNDDDVADPQRRPKASNSATTPHRRDDEDREAADARDHIARRLRRLHYVNPSLVAPLTGVWMAGRDDLAAAAAAATDSSSRRGGQRIEALMNSV